MEQAARPNQNLKRWVVCGVLVLVGIVLSCLGLAIAHPLGRAFFRGMFQVSQPADVANPNTFEGPTCTVDYPGNWVVEVDDEDYDPASQFIIDAPAQGNVSLFIHEAGTPVGEIVDAVVDELDGGLVQSAVRIEFDTWGAHTGYGVELDGMVTLFPGKVRVFGIETDEGSAVIVETRFDEDERKAAPGHDLIAETFRFRSE